MCLTLNPLSNGEGSTAGVAQNHLIQTHRPKLSPLFSPRYPIQLPTIHGWWFDDGSRSLWVVNGVHL